MRWPSSRPSAGGEARRAWGPSFYGALLLASKKGLSEEGGRRGGPHPAHQRGVRHEGQGGPFFSTPKKGLPPHTHRAAHTLRPGAASPRTPWGPPPSPSALLSGGGREAPLLSLFSGGLPPRAAPSTAALSPSGVGAAVPLSRRREGGCGRRREAPMPPLFSGSGGLPPRAAFSTGAFSPPELRGALAEEGGKAPLPPPPSDVDGPPASERAACYRGGEWGGS